jgi:hypothetical protein
LKGQGFLDFCEKANKSTHIHIQGFSFFNSPKVLRNGLKHATKDTKPKGEKGWHKNETNINFLISYGLNLIWLPLDGQIFMWSPLDY